MLADSFQVGQEPTADGPGGLGEDRNCIPVDPAVDNVRKLVDRSFGQIRREPREDGEREPVASRRGPALPWVETVGEMGAQANEQRILPSSASTVCQAHRARRQPL